MILPSISQQQSPDTKVLHLEKAEIYRYIESCWLDYITEEAEGNSVLAGHYMLALISALLIQKLHPA